MSDWQQRYKRLLFDRPHPKVLRVTMNRPEKLNATDAIMHRHIADVWRATAGVTTRLRVAAGDDAVCCGLLVAGVGKGEDDPGFRVPVGDEGGDIVGTAGVAAPKAVGATQPLYLAPNLSDWTVARMPISKSPLH